MLRIYVADMGAGNTNIYCIEPTGTDPSSMTEKDGEPSGYVVYKIDNIMGVGKSGIYRLKYSDLSDLKKIKLNWKKVPTEENRAELTEYFRAWIERLRNSINKEQYFGGVDEEIWFVGCPTGGKWKRKSVRKLYKEILEDAGFKNVTIIPESNGALAYYQKEQHILDKIQSTTKLILIDLGAYSIDATLFSGGKITSYGQYLGAGLIDRMIVRAVLYGPETRYRVGKKFINDPETVKKALEEYEKEMREVKKAREEHKDSENEPCRIFYEFLQIAARRVKEQFFSSQIDGTYKGNDVRVDSGLSYAFDDDDPPDIIEFFFNEKMRQILMEQDTISEALGDEFEEEPPEVREYIGGLTWMETLEKFLNETADVFDLDDGTDVCIMLTGGGSLMKCVQDKIQCKIQEKITGRFPAAQVYKDREAVKAIGYGLARWGPDKIRAMDFEKKYREFVARPENRSYLETAYRESVDEMKRDVAEQETAILTDCLDDWKNYRYASTDIPDHFEQAFGKWCAVTGAPNFAADFAAKVHTIKQKINDDFMQLVVTPMNLAGCLGDLTTLLPDEDKLFVADSEQYKEFAFNIIAEIIVEHYKGSKEWLKDFNNEDKPEKSFIDKYNPFYTPKDPRKDFFDRNREILEKWPSKEKDQTHKLCIDVFCEHKFKFKQAKMTLLEKFVDEAEDYLLNWLLEPLKKAILGNLVLEEILPEEE